MRTYLTGSVATLEGDLVSIEPMLFAASVAALFKFLGSKLNGSHPQPSVGKFSPGIATDARTATAELPRSITWPTGDSTIRHCWSASACPVIRCCTAEHSRIRVRQFEPEVIWLAGTCVFNCVPRRPGFAGRAGTVRRPRHRLEVGPT
jgi:hypothetical protein